VLETVLKKRESYCKRLGWVQPNSSSVWHTGQCPVRQAGPRELAALRIRRRHTAKIHRTIRWCTGLSSEPTVASANGWPRNLRATRGSSNGRKEAPDCPVCTGQCPVRQRAWSCNGRLCPFWKEIAHRTGYSSCPVRHSTEGRNCLPRLSPTAPSYLGAIKGVPRRMEESPKHSLSILRLQLHAFDSLC
jgi:hypothetical protein